MTPFPHHSLAYEGRAEKHIRHDVAVEPLTAPHDGHFQNPPEGSNEAWPESSEPA